MDRAALGGRARGRKQNANPSSPRSAEPPKYALAHTIPQAIYIMLITCFIVSSPRDRQLGHTAWCVPTASCVPTAWCTHCLVYTLVRAYALVGVYALLGVYTLLEWKSMHSLV